MKVAKVTKVIQNGHNSFFLRTQPINKNEMNATYVSVWDGSTEVRTSCQYNPETKTVESVESTDDVEDLDILFEEFVEFNGEVIKDFIIDDEQVTDGQRD